MVSVSSPLQLLHLLRNTCFPQLSLPVLCFSFQATLHSPRRLFALRTGSNGGEIRSHEAYVSDLLRRPIVSKDFGGNSDEDEGTEGNSHLSEGEEGEEEDEEDEEDEEENEVVDWEDKILEETVPLVGFVRMILHSGRYASGDQLRPEHQRTILEKLLPYHPESEKKIGCGIGYITIGYHPDFESSRCLFIVRTDGQLVDFSYWKCIKGLIRTKYPLYADTFILRHFRRRRRYEGR